MDSEPRLTRGLFAALLAAASAAAGWNAARYLDRALTDGGLGRTGWFCGFAAVAVGLAGFAGWLGWMAFGGEPPNRVRSTLRIRMVVGVLGAVCVGGLSALTVVFAVNDHTGAAVLVGALGLAVYGAVSGSLPDDRDEARTWVVVALAVVSVGCVGGLAVRFAAQDRLLPALLLGGTALLLATIPFLEDVGGWRKQSALNAALVATVGSLGCVGVMLIRGGRLLLASPLLVAATFCFFYLLFTSVEEGQLRRRRQRGAHGRATPRIGISLPAGASALAVPLGTVAWLVVFRGDAGASSTAEDVLRGVGTAAGTACGLLPLQILLLFWLSPRPPRGLLADTAERTRQEALQAVANDEEWRPAASEGSPLAPYPGAGPPPYPYPYSSPGRYPPAGYPPGGYRPDLYDPYVPHPHRRSERVAAELRRLTRQEFGSAPALTHPFDSPAVLGIQMATAHRTGLDIDAVWPRLALVVPPHARRTAQRHDRALTALRVTAVSGILTAVAWGLLALRWAPDRPNAAAVVFVVVAPLLVALAAGHRARERLADAYTVRADLVALHRAELAAALRLPVPRTEAELVAMAGALSGDDPSGGPLVAQKQREAEQEQRRRESEREQSAALRSERERDATAQALTGPQAEALTGDLSGQVLRMLREQLGQEIPAMIIPEVRRMLAAHLEELRATLPAGLLGEPELDLLARQISGYTTGTVSTDLIRHVTDVQGELDARIREAVRSGVEESVTGPQLANFTGYLLVELDPRGHEGAGGDAPTARALEGRIVARPGHKVALALSVVRADQAREVASVLETAPDKPFFVFEPVHIEGGRDAASVDFDAVVDCATLTPLPHRRSLRVTAEGEMTFAFRLPEEEGVHEIWFQLYQGGRLIQVVAVEITARADAAEVSV